MSVPTFSEYVAMREGMLSPTRPHKSGTKLHLHGSCCLVRFEAKGENTESHGPFKQVEAIGGAIDTQPGRVLLARLDTGNRQWYAYESERWWPGLVVEKCSEGEPA